MDSLTKKLLNKKMHELTDAEWDARGDAQVLANAEIIRGDAARLSKAVAWSKVLAVQEQKSVDSFKKVGGGEDS